MNKAFFHLLRYQLVIFLLQSKVGGMIWSHLDTYFYIFLEEGRWPIFSDFMNWFMFLYIKPTKMFHDIAFHGKVWKLQQRSRNMIKYVRRRCPLLLRCVCIYISFSSIVWFKYFLINTASVSSWLLLIKVLCKSHPVEFASYFHYCHSLTFDQRPDYGFLKRLFRDLFAREGTVVCIPPFISVKSSLIFLAYTLTFPCLKISNFCVAWWSLLFCSWHVLYSYVFYAQQGLIVSKHKA